jgi:conjugal transfer ATP-binding protein TraC
VSAVPNPQAAEQELARPRFSLFSKRKQPRATTRAGDAEDFVQPRRNADLPFNKLASALPYTAWDEESRLFLIEGDKPDTVESVGFCLELRPQTGSSEEMADYLTTLFTSGAPPDTGVQIQIFGSPDLTNFCDQFERVTQTEAAFEAGSARQEQARLLRTMMERRREFYEKGAREGLFADLNFRMRDFRALVSVVVPVPKTVRGKFQVANEAWLGSSQTRAWFTQIGVLRETFITSLKSYFLFSHEHGPADLINWCAAILNIQRTVAGDRFDLEYDPGREIRHQILASDTKIVESEMDLEFSDERHPAVAMRGLSIRSYPKAFALQGMNNLMGSTTNTTLSYPCPFLVTLGVRLLDYDSEKNKTVLKAARATQGSESPMARFQPDMIDKKADWDIAQAAFDDGKGVVKLYHQVLLFTSPEELSRSEQAARAIWRAENFDTATDRKMQKQALLSSLPMMFGPLLQRDMSIAMRTSTKTVFNAANMMPILAEPTGVGAPVLTLFGRRGQAMGIDIFANPSGNFNGCVVGTSGSGKSFLLNELTQRTLATGGRVWIIDVGRSYEKLCRMLGGQYIEFKHGSDICLNPFSMVNDLDEDMQLLKPLLAQMVSPSKPLEDYQLAQLDINVRQLWEEFGQKMTVTQLAERLKRACYQGGSKEAFNPEAEVDPESCDPRIRDLGVQLFPFTEVGTYGRYFNGPANVQFESDLVVLELEELNSMKELRSVVMFLLMYKITQEMYHGDRSRKGLVIIDEAWSLMGDGASGDFIEAGYRRARKYGWSFFTGTQGVGDYYSSPTAKAAFDNADWMFFLRQKAESVEALANSNKLVLDEYMRTLIKSVTTRQGAYSEVFVRCGDLPASVGRLFVDPFTQVLNSSKAEDFRAVKQYEAMGLDVASAIDRVLADKGARA